MPAFPKLKLETITSPFKGKYTTSPEIASMVGILDRFIPKKDRSKMSIIEIINHSGGKNLIPMAYRVLPLTSSGPNTKCQVFGYPIDAFALKQNPILLEHFKVVSDYLGKDI
jgi:hypothetical protein